MGVREEGRRKYNVMKILIFFITDRTGSTHSGC